MYFYEPGSSLAPKNTYSDNALSIPNSNPVILSSSGVLPNVFLDGAYRVILKDKNGVQQWDRDSISSISELSFADWDTTINYGVGGTNIVYASNGKYYVSIQTPNLGNEPSVSPTYWKLAIDYFLESQTTIEPGHIGVGGDPDGIVSLNTKTKGTLAVGNGTTTTALAVGANTLALTADSTAPQGVAWLPVPDTARDYQAFTASGTWTKPADAQFVKVEIWSAGGGGGGAASTNPIGGGSGGEYVTAIFNASGLSATETVTIGAGGAGGTGAAGSTGGNTTFGSLLTAIGGNPGATASNYSAIPRSRLATASSGGAGALFASLIFSNAGYGAANGSSAPGGNTLYGGGGGGGGDSTASAGGTSEIGGAGGAGATSGTATAGSAPAGGGGGASGGGTGGAGARGEAKIWTW